MNKEIKTKWLNALRSGEYVQGTGCLQVNGQFCCLGVLCDIHAKETGQSWAIRGSKMFRYIDSSFALPGQVKEWAGLSLNNPYIEDISIAQYNDGDYKYSVPKKSFLEIADLIEKHL